MAEPQTKFDYPRNDVLESAPPDDGGHQGSYTRPQDMLIEPANTGQRGGGPALQYTNDFPKERTSTGAPVTGLLFIVAALVLGLLLAFWVW
jgi:hypothetical protein